MLPFIYDLIIPKLIKRLKVDVILNFADIPIRTNISQIFLFDWAYAVYLKENFWLKMNIKDLLKRRMKVFYFRKNIKYIDLLTSQTEVIKNRIEKLYKIDGVKVIPNAVSIENFEDTLNKKDFNLGDGIKLLYLTKYYSHKNLEIMIPLAKIIKEKNLNYKIILTINPKNNKSAKIILEKIKKYGLEKVVLNIGNIDMKYVPSLYRQCQGLLMPTLLESFSGTYVEAMFHKIPIITSDKDFTREICKESAEYFDPLDVSSILKSINNVFLNNKRKEFLVNEGNKVLNSFLTWEEVFFKYEVLIKQFSKKNR